MATQSARFRPSFGLVNGRPLFLDLADDSYFLLEPAEEASLLCALTAGHSDNDLLPVHSVCPRREFVHFDETPTRFALADMVQVWWTVRQVRRGLARRPLADLIDAISRAHPRSGNRAEGLAASVLATHFQSVRRWLPQTPNCLSDSLALLLFLKSHGASAELVFGAKLDPFAAHCWIQADDLLLNDRIDRIEGFTVVGVIKA